MGAASKARAYYNEFDPFAAEWLRGLIKDGRIADGDVDDRSITEVRAQDLEGYTQCHFFAGIGGWSYALRLAGWPDDRAVWTGSCPCQPFSIANKNRAAMQDERHLWPEFFRLSRECCPSVVFGEQVKNAIAEGWLDLVANDLEGEGYAVAAAVLPACSVGAPHQRDRLWWVATNACLTKPAGWNPNRRRCECSPIVVETPADSHQKRSTNGQVERCLQPQEIALDRCFVGQDWETWGGGFSGFGRVDDGLLRELAKSAVGAFGNAIVPQVAAEFIIAADGCRK